METETHLAANGHIMVYLVLGTRPGPDGERILSQWDAWHSDTCPCSTYND
jgi:hypothetical protein